MRSRIVSATMFVATLLAADLIFFRVQVANGFSVLFGESFDGVIENALLEHWHNVVRGLSRWDVVNYFYPHEKTLGYNDGYLIFGLIGSVYRSFGFDPFLSSEFVNITIKSIGFAAYYAAGRRILRLSPGWALFGAALFTISHASYRQGGHAQLFSVSFVPLLALLVWEANRHLRDRDGRYFILFGIVAGAFYAAWLITAFYMAWFFFYITMFFVIGLLILERDAFLDTATFAFRERLGALAIIGAVTLVAAAPFLWIYLPSARETGMHGFDEAAYYTPALKDVINVGKDNYVFGSLYTGIVKALCPRCDIEFSERITGITPVMLVLLALAVRWIVRGRKTGDRRIFLATIAFALILSWLLTVHYGGLKVWYLIYHTIPGAKAVRVVSRYQIFLAAPVIALVVSYLASVSPRLPKAISLSLCALLLVSELDSGSSAVVALNRKTELDSIAVSTPPPECHSFFVSAAPGQVSDTRMNALYPHNVQAMMIAETINLPTINGYASFRPPDWFFGGPDRSGYTSLVARYAALHGLSGLCHLDLTTRQWQPNWRAD